MTRGLFTASVVAAAAMAIGPASSGLLNQLAQQATPSVRGTGDRTAVVPPSSLRVPSSSEPEAPAPIEHGAFTNDTAPRPALTMVPRNRKLESRLRAMLPSGMTVRQAAQGFSDQGQFVSAVHVSRNLDIPFTRLKSKIVDERLTIGQAIQVLRPDADVWRELTRARDQVSRDPY